MPKFNFRLQKILDLKKHKEEELKQQLAKLLFEYQSEEKFLNYLKEMQIKYQEELKEKQKSYLDIYILLSYYAYLYKVNNDILNQIEILKKLQEKIDEKTQEVIFASKERKIFEKLKEKKFSIWKKEMEKLEQKFLDEIGINKYAKEG